MLYYRNGYRGEFPAKGSTRVGLDRRRPWWRTPRGGVEQLDRHGHDPAPPVQPVPELELARARAELEASERYAAELGAELRDSERRVERLREELEHSQALLRLSQAARAAPLDDARRRTRGKGSLSETTRALARRVTLRR